MGHLVCSCLHGAYIMSGHFKSHEATPGIRGYTMVAVRRWYLARGRAKVSEKVTFGHAGMKWESKAWELWGNRVPGRGSSKLRVPKWKLTLLVEVIVRPAEAEAWVGGWPSLVDFVTSFPTTNPLSSYRQPRASIWLRWDAIEGSRQGSDKIWFAFYTHHWLPCGA